MQHIEYFPLQREEPADALRELAAGQPIPAFFGNPIGWPTSSDNRARPRPELEAALDRARGLGIIEEITSGSLTRMGRSVISLLDRGAQYLHRRGRLASDHRHR